MNFNGYELFFHIKNPNLRTYNRINTYLNVVERHGKEVGRKYLKKFSKNDKLAIFSMLKDMYEEGFEQYRRNFIRERNA